MSTAEPVTIVNKPSKTAFQLTRESPWLGLRSFDESNRDYFYGRSNETAELIDRVSQRRLTVLFGRSGLGKTSLLRASVIPGLKSRGLRTVYIRLVFDSEAPPLGQQVVDEILDQLSLGGAEEDYDCVGLWELLHDPRYGLVNENPDEQSDFVLLFDQFEEIHTLGDARRAADVDHFLSVLAAIIENRPTDEMMYRLERDDELADRLIMTSSPVKVLFSLRDDFLHWLERWRPQMPSVMENRLELLALRGPEALQVVTGPARKRSKRDPDLPAIVDDATAELIVRFVAGVNSEVPIERISNVPPLLNLVCEQLNSSRIAEDKLVIDAEAVKGQAQSVLSDFYNCCFADFPNEVRYFVEDELLSDSGFRESITVDSAVAKMGRRGIEKPQPILLELVNQRLLTIDDRRGAPRVELTHDILTPIASESRIRRLDEQAAIASRLQTAKRFRKRLKWLTAVGLVAALLVGYSLFEINRERQHQASLARTTNEKLEAERNLSATVIQQLDKASETQFYAGLGSFAEQLAAGRPTPSRFFGKNRVHEAIGYWSRSLSINSKNVESANALYSLLKSRSSSDFGLWPIEDWGIPVVNQVALSPKGNRAIFASGSDVFVAGPQMNATKLEHHSAVRSMRFSHGGQWILSSTSDNMVCIWNAESGKLVQTLRQTGEVISCAASEKDEFAVVVRRPENDQGNATASVWDTSTGKMVREIANYDQPINDGDLFDGGFVMFRKLPGDAQAPTSRPEINFLVAQTWSTGEESHFELKDFDSEHVFFTDPTSKKGMLVSNLGQVVFDFEKMQSREAICNDNEYRGNRKKEELAHFRLGGSGATFVSFGASLDCFQDENLFVGSFDDTLDLRIAKPGELVSPESNPVFFNDGRYILIRPVDTSVIVWDTESKSRFQTIYPSSPVRSMAFDAERNSVILLGVDNRIQVAAIRDDRGTSDAGETLADPFELVDRVPDISLSFDPKLQSLVAECEDKTIEVDLDLKHFKTVKPEVSGAVAARVNAKTSANIVADEEGNSTLQITDEATGQILKDILVNPGSDRLASNSNHVVTANSHVVQVWSREDDRQIGPSWSVGQFRLITGLDIDPSGRWVLVSHRPNTICDKQITVDLYRIGKPEKQTTFGPPNLAFVKFSETGHIAIICRTTNGQPTVRLQNIETQMPDSDVLKIDSWPKINQVAWMGNNLYYVAGTNLKRSGLASLSTSLTRMEPVKDSVIQWCSHVAGFQANPEKGLTELPEEKRIAYLREAGELPGKWGAIQKQFFDVHFWARSTYAESAIVAEASDCQIESPNLPKSNRYAAPVGYSDEVAKRIRASMAKQASASDGDSVSVLESNTQRLFPKRKKFTNTIDMDFVRIESGQFDAGSHETPAQVAGSLGAYPNLNNEKLRRIEIENPFFIGSTEVTVRQFSEFVSDEAYHGGSVYKTQAEKGELFGAATGVDLAVGASWQQPDEKWKVTPEHPVSYVTYNDAAAFCKWLSAKEGRKYRLPTDDEWEYAARAGTKTRFWNGDSVKDLTKIANVPDASLARVSEAYREPAQKGIGWTDADDGFSYVAPVASFPANPWGLHDVHGNVFEWSLASDFSSLMIQDPSLKQDGVAVLKGGCFY